VRRGQQKTHDRFQPWVLVEIRFLRSTKRHGDANYGDNQHNLPNENVHQWAEGSDDLDQGQAQIPSAG
jgi:hypothetical protein